MFPPPILTDEFYYAVMNAFWNRPRETMSFATYKAWAGRYQPIEDEL